MGVRIPTLNAKINRRTALAGLGASALAMPAIIRAAQADPSNTIRWMGSPTTALDDWSSFERDTGLKMEFTPFFTDNVGAFYNEMLVNRAGDRIDIINSLAGSQKRLVQEGQVSPLDLKKLKNYDGILPTIKNSSLLHASGGKDWAVPLAFNADSFGYFPDKLGLPRPPEPLTWDVVLNDKKTLGRTAIEGDVMSLVIAGMYVKSHNIAEIADPANMTAEECKLATDWLIGRKKAGQFRSFWKTYDEQVANFTNGEVIAQQCWEPAVKGAKTAGLDVEYATCNDFYYLWMHSLFVPAQAAGRGNLDNIYKALDWIIGGAYAAEINRKYGYTSARVDLGLEYAKAHGWSTKDIENLQFGIDKTRLKFQKPHFWVGGAPDALQVHEAELARFRNA
ncbi:extracellular solute-binding protein [Bradyrhizobium sp. 168]|uniref:ABC transporter substrate-binding protein n=1 Tax=Bradyrhizobium sp. 168 TaxID=2782639 RepID=UPI001FFBDF7D|nr:extracellular solute-binding protein [Bradyrhizobium sp. 168]MCK1579768.1 extracellular solute-binding protein [Bradyrhizobium sp. 168]